MRTVVLALVGMMIWSCGERSSETMQSKWENDTEQEEDCHPSYPDVCIPAPPPDLDCADVAYSGFSVEGSDPHRFDGDNDGIGCE